MDNEINLFDMLLAKKLGGRGGALEPVVYTATGWNELPYIDKSEFFPASETEYIDALGFLSFSFSGEEAVIPVVLSGLNMRGGNCDLDGFGATMILSYNTANEEWRVIKAWTNLMGSWTDFTSAVQVGASDIVLTLFK